MKAVLACLAALATWATPLGAQAPAPPPTTTAAERWCDQLPRAANAARRRIETRSQWFQVYEAAYGVYALVEPFQFQEAISYLIVGKDRALLFDSGIGLVPIRPVVEELTRLPVEVLNSHTHFDHVGGNAEFERILAVDTPYTRANAKGFAHVELRGEVEPGSFCKGAPAGVDVAAYHTRAWRPSRFVADLEKIDLGGRVLEVLQVPGHTPDALALLDRSRGLLWTGDSYYEGAIWLYVPETDLDAYERSIARLAALVPDLRQLLPAHNTAAAEPRRLVQTKEAIRRVRSGQVKGVAESGNRLVFEYDGISILTSRAVLDGKQGDGGRGGSGLTQWP